MSLISRITQKLPKRLMAAAALIAIAVMLPVSSLAADKVQLEGTIGVANQTAGQTKYGPSTNASYDQVVKVEVYYHNKELPDSGKIANNLKVKINNRVVLDIQGINTQKASVDSFVNMFSFQGFGRTDYKIDDIYICDTSTGPGTNPCNTFLGDRRVITLLPTSSGQTGWTPSQGNNVTALNASNAAVSYNSTSTAGAEDTFRFNDLPQNVSNIAGVQVNGTYQNSDASAHTLTQRIISGGVEVVGDNPLSPYNLSSSDVTYSDMFPVDPSTGDVWQPSALRNGLLQAGYKLES